MQKYFLGLVFMTLGVIMPFKMQAGTTLPITVKAASENSVRLTWSAYAGAEKYKIQVIKDATGSVVAQYRTTNTSKTIRNLADGEDYTFKVLPKVAGAFNKKAYTSTNATTDLDFTPSTTVLTDTFEQTTNNAIFNYPDNVEYVSGHSGYGIHDVYDLLDNGATLRANTFYYDNTDNVLMNTEAGTVTMWVSPSADYNDGANHKALSAWTNGRYHNWGIQMYYNSFDTATLSVHRDYQDCLRYSFNEAFEFEKDEWYKLTLTWRGAETRFYINDEEVGEFEADTRTVVGGTDVPGRVNLGDDVFITDDLTITAESPILVRDKATAQTELIDVACPGLTDLIESSDEQETYQGIKLYNFSDSDTRDALKELIDLLPAAFDGEVNHIAVVDDADYDAWRSPTAKADYSFAIDRSIFLRESLFDTAAEVTANAKTIFHEFGHAHTYANQLNYGGPQSSNKAKEWASISGASSYVGECAEPTEILLDKGFLTAYASTMADEDLAEWVGISMDLYRTGSTFSDLLNPDSEKYSPLYQQKIDFLEKYDFLTAEIIDEITQDTANTEYYTEFND